MSSCIYFKKVTPQGITSLVSFSRNSDIYDLFHHTETPAMIVRATITDAQEEVRERIESCNRYIARTDEIFPFLKDKDELWENREDKELMTNRIDELKKILAYLDFLYFLLIEDEEDENTYLTWEML